MSPIKILLSAFACDPYFGSDEEVGWQWAKQLSSRGFDVTVITRASHQLAIESHVAKTGECKNVVFSYVDMPRLHQILKKINRRNHIYYYFWQWQAYRRAQVLHQQTPFDLVHHITWVSFRQPSFMGRLGIPFYFGPAAGGDEIPSGYIVDFSLKQKLVEYVRFFANALVKFDPFMRATFASAERVYFTSKGHLRRVSSDVAQRARIELAIGSDGLADQVDNTKRGPAREVTQLLFAGRSIGWKGMDLGLEIFARACARNSNLHLTVVGDGDDLQRWKNKAQKLNLGNKVTWLGWLKKEEVLKRYSEFDVLFYPSLRDSGGFVVLEALQAGLPVVCFKLGGPGVVVNDTCGAAIEAGADLKTTLDEYAKKLLEVVVRTQQDANLSEACRARVKEFSWNALIERIYGDK